MRLARISSALIVAVALSVTGISNAFAQHPATVGELIEKGGKKLGSDELTKLLSGSDASGILASQPHSFEETYKKNGTLEGRLIGARADGRNLPYWGKWFVNERSELCIDINSNAGGVKSCNAFYELGGKYYLGKDDKSAPVYHREIRR